MPVLWTNALLLPAYVLISFLFSVCSGQTVASNLTYCNIACQAAQKAGLVSFYNSLQGKDMLGYERPLLVSDLLCYEFLLLWRD